MKIFFPGQTSFCFSKKNSSFISPIQPKCWTHSGGGGVKWPFFPSQKWKVRFRHHCRKMHRDYFFFDIFCFPHEISCTRSACKLYVLKNAFLITCPYWTTFLGTLAFPTVLFCFFNEFHPHTMYLTLQNTTRAIWFAAIETATCAAADGTTSEAAETTISREKSQYFPLLNNITEWELLTKIISHIFQKAKQFDSFDLL